MLAPRMSVIERREEKRREERRRGEERRGEERRDQRRREERRGEEKREGEEKRSEKKREEKKQQISEINTYQHTYIYIIFVVVLFCFVFVFLVFIFFKIPELGLSPIAYMMSRFFPVFSACSRSTFSAYLYAIAWGFPNSVYSSSRPIFSL